MGSESILAICCLTASASALVLVPAAVEGLDRWASRLAAVLMGRGLARPTRRDLAREAYSTIARDGVPALLPPARILLGVGPVNAAVRNAVVVARWRGVQTDAPGLLSCLLLVSAILGFLLSLLLGSALTGCGVALVIIWAGGIWVSQQGSRRVEELRRQVPDAIRCLIACFQVGYSIPQAFRETARELDAPAKPLFQRVSQDMEMGRTVNEALVEFRDSSDIPELVFIAVALDIQHTCGGSVVPVLQVAEDSVKGSLDLRRSLQTQTAQARLSARMVSIMPVLLLVILSAISPGYALPFFQSATGLCVLLCAVGMQVLGIILVNRILDVEVA